MKALQSFKTSVHTTKHEMIPARREERGGGVVSDAVRGTALYSGDKWNGTGRGDRAFHYYHALKKKKSSISCSVCSECSVNIFSE